MKLSIWFATFKKSLIGSLSDLNYYVEILNTPLRFSLKFVAWFYLFLGILLTLIFVVKDLPQINSDINATRSELVTNYPDTLVFNWKDGQLSSNAEQPITVSYPSVFPPSERLPKNLALIDTDTDVAPENLNVLFFVNRSKLFINSLQGNWAEVDLVKAIEVQSATIDKTKIVELAESSKETQREAISVLPGLILIKETVGLFLSRIFILLLNSLIIQLIFQILNKPLTYKKVFQLGLHALIPAELLYQYSVLLFPQLGFSMFSLTFWLIMVLIIWHLRHLQVLQVSVEKDRQTQK